MVVILAMVVASLALGPAAFARDGHDSDRDQHWVGTWATAPQSVEPNPPFSSPNVVFTDQTIREIVHTSVAGHRVRVRLSNAFGTYGSAPLTIGDAHIALRQQNSTIVPGTDRQLTFGGATSTLIPAGAFVISDPVDLDLPTFSDLAISIYLPGPTGQVTYHATALETNYIVSGDMTSAASLPGAQTNSSWYFLTGVEVSTRDDHARAVVTLGASITDGTMSTPNTNQRWPDDLARRLIARYGPAEVAVLNEGIAGNRLIFDAIGPNGPARFDRDVVAQAGVKYVVVADLPINDVGFPVIVGPSQAVTGDQIIGGLKQLIRRAHEKGLKIIAGTLTPYKGAFYWTATGEAIREQVNDFIRSGAFDGVVDFAGATADPNNPLVYAAQFDSGDHLHPNDAGYQAMANAFDLSLFRKGEDEKDH
ncbi:MAG: SGNH/GDSL hydrolase family protein [Fimbriimonadales bacterium]